jgi:hypothetical protein
MDGSVFDIGRVPDEAEADGTPASLPAHQAPPRRLSGTFFTEFSAPSRAPVVRVPGDFCFRYDPGPHDRHGTVFGV